MFWFIVSAILLLFALRFRCPYFIAEAKYVHRMAIAVYRMTKHLKSKPFYTLLDRFLDSVQKNPHKACIRFQDETYSYAQSDKQSNKIARSLLKHADLHEGDTVALLLGNEPMFLWIWLALAKIGCSAALFNHNIRSKSLLHCFTCCGASVLIAGAGNVTHPVQSFVCQSVLGVVTVFAVKLLTQCAAGPCRDLWRGRCSKYKRGTWNKALNRAVHKIS